MFALFVVLTLIAAVLLIGVVLIQKSKGGGLSSTFAGSNQIMGVRRTNNFIEKATWWLAAAIVVFAVCGTYTARSDKTSDESRVKAPVQTEQTTGGNYDTNLPVAMPAEESVPTAETPAAPSSETSAPVIEETPAVAAEEAPEQK